MSNTSRRGKASAFNRRTIDTSLNLLGMGSYSVDSVRMKTGQSLKRRLCGSGVSIAMWESPRRINDLAFGSSM